VQADNVSSIYPDMTKNKQTLATLIELANLPDAPEAVKRFEEKHSDYGLLRGDTLKVRDDVRKLWLNGEPANGIASFFLFDEPFGLWMLNARVWMEQKLAGKDVKIVRHSPVGVDWRRGELTYQWQNEFQHDLYTLLKSSRLAKICARPDCPYTPYFVANDTRTRYCSTDCADAMQDKWRNDWWKTHGKAWRKKRNRGKGK